MSSTLFPFLFLLVTLPACTAEEVEDEGGTDDVDLRAGKVGAYFVDGTKMTAEAGGVIARISKRTDSKVVKVKKYFAGPAVLCGDSNAAGSCDALVSAVKDAICEDLRSRRIDRFVVFGYSRGVFIANKAASQAQRECGTGNNYGYGGFVDAVMMTPSLKGAEHVPGTTKWFHYHRRSTEHLVFPVKMLSGGDGENAVGHDITHPDMGYDSGVEQMIMKAANRDTGMKVFK